jgi:hypothetical protein
LADSLAQTNLFDRSVGGNAEFRDEIHPFWHGTGRQHSFGLRIAPLSIKQAADPIFRAKNPP